MALPPLPSFDRAALLLDLDGTLLDFAPTPDAVVVAPGLRDDLAKLRQQLQSALGVVTGRPVETVDALLQDVPFAVAGEHGGAIRHAPGEPIERPHLPTPSEAWLQEAERLAAAFPGAILERKAHGFALHFRAVPEAEPVVHDALAQLLEGCGAFELLPAQMLWEVRPRGAHKGTALNALMVRAPFAGRLPVFIGDDVTDKDAIAAAEALGGVGLWVPDLFGNAAGVRAWLAAAAATGEWPACS